MGRPVNPLFPAYESKQGIFHPNGSDMKNSKPISVKEQRNPTTPVVMDMDELAKLWIEVVLQQIQKRQSFSCKRVHKIML
ncbi:MAG: hypothetical protein ABH819_03820 [Patescibacteria group bacterium]